MAISRGVYCLADLPPVGDPDLVTVAARVPKAIIALLSALHFHGITTEIPHHVTIALPRGTSSPRLDWPPLQIVRLSGPAYSYGAETHRRNGVALRVYDAAKTVADCFKFRNKIGTDVAVEALRDFRRRHPKALESVWSFAEVNRVSRVLRPYLESLA